MRVLEEAGIEFLNEEACDLFREAGCTVEGDTVHQYLLLPRYWVEAGRYVQPAHIWAATLPGNTAATRDEVCPAFANASCNTPLRSGFRIIGKADMAAPYAEPCTNATAPVGPDDYGTAPVVIENANVSQPDTVRKARAHRLDRGFLARETHGEKTHRVFGTAIELELFIHENAACKMLTVAVINALHAASFDDIGTNSENHAPVTLSALRA